VYLRHRVQLLLMMLAMLVVADVALDRYLVIERDDLRTDVRQRWEPARTAAAEVLFGLVDQETGERGFLITGEEEFLAPYRLGGARVDAAMAQLELLVEGDAAIQPKLRRVRDRVNAWRQLGATFEIGAKQSEGDDRVRALVATGTSMMLFDEARVEIASLRASIIDRLRVQERRVDRLETRISGLRVASAVVALAIVAVASGLMRRWLTRPLGQLTTSARTIASGDLTHQIPSPGPPELAGLGRDVEAMRKRILDEVDHSARARSSLVQRGMIMLTLRDELAPSPIEPPASVRVATRFRPAETFLAGDWYDVRRDGEHRLTFVLADVSGHGPNAAVFALKTKQLVGIALDQGLAPAAAWAWVAERLGDTGDQFLTGVIATVDVAGGRLTYASAGHPHLLLRSAEGISMLGPTGPLVGLVPGPWGEADVDLPAGSCLLAYTDGLLEVRDASGGWADLGDLRARLNGTGVIDVEQLADMCLEFHDHFDGRERSDDVTVVVVGVGD
jgi:CHASE3 domain sensor protein